MYEAFDEPYRGDFVNSCSVVLSGYIHCLLLLYFLPSLLCLYLCNRVPIALICELLVVIVYTHTLVRIGVTIVTHRDIHYISPCPLLVLSVNQLEQYLNCMPVIFLSCSSCRYTYITGLYCGLGFTG